MVLVKIHKKDGKILAAVCDAELLGKKFEEGPAQLEATHDFFKGEECDDAEAGDLMRNADHVNLIGEKSIKLGIHEGVIDAAIVKKVHGIPHAQAVIVHD